MGPSSLVGLARALRDLGEHVIEPAPVWVSAAGPPYYARLAEAFVAASGVSREGAPVVLAGHSGAGGLLPAIAEAFEPEVRAAIFIDAILPHPGSGWFDTAPAALVSRLRSRVEARLLPRWDQWFSAKLLADLIPDDEMREACVAELPAVPEAYGDAIAPACPSWPPRAVGYLQLSDAYDGEAGDARRLGWIWRRERLHHLAPLTHPVKVAESLQSLIDALPGAA